jgi:hypothetical protein
MRYEVTTGLTPREALEQAATYFGHGDVGLHAVSQTPHSLVFQGGGGHVAISVQPGATTTLELETREWDVAVQKFMRQHQPSASLVGTLVAPETPRGPAIPGVHHPQQCVGGAGRSRARAGDRGAAA